MNKLISLFNKYKEVIMYLIFGVLTTVLTLLIYYILSHTIFDPKNPILLQCDNIISWIFGVIFAYVTNRKYVFVSKNNNIMKEMIGFIGARLVTLFMDMIIMYIGVTLLKENDLIIKLISQIVVIVSNYLFSKIFIFKKNYN